jgi:putative endonuclease
VARWYAAHGYQIVERNWRCTEGEVDIVARRPGTLVICEVKARRNAAFGGPAAAVGHDKQMRLRRLALRYLAENGMHEPVIRFDVACVVGAEIDVIEGAF